MTIQTITVGKRMMVSVLKDGMEYDSFVCSASNSIEDVQQIVQAKYEDSLFN